MKKNSIMLLVSLAFIARLNSANEDAGSSAIMPALHEYEEEIQEVANRDIDRAFECVKNGDASELEDILEQNLAMIVQKDRLGNTLLHCAAAQNDFNVTTLLLQHGADIAPQNNFGHTPLHRASKRGFAEIVRLLLTHGAIENAQTDGGVVNARTNQGLTPLALAATGEVVHLLVDNRADVAARDSMGATPLHNAATSGKEDVVQALIAHHASTSVKDTAGRNPLHNARNVSVAHLLINAGANVNEPDNNGWTPLHTASSNRKSAVVRVLLENGGQHTAQTNAGETPLHLAGSRQVVEMLINNGADLTARDRKGRTPILRAAKKGLYGAYATLHQKLLLGHHILAFLDRQGNSVIHYAGSAEIAKANIFERRVTAIAVGCMFLPLIRLNGFSKSVDFIRCCWNGNLRGEDDMTPLHCAAMRGNVEVARVFLAYGANVSARNKDDMTPLHYAKNGAMVKLLLANEAQINAESDIGFTPLHIASRRGKVSAARALVNHGAQIDVEGKTRPNMTALDLTVRRLLHGPNTDRTQKNLANVAYALIQHFACVKPETAIILDGSVPNWRSVQRAALMNLYRELQQGTNTLSADKDSAQVILQMIDESFNPMAQK